MTAKDDKSFRIVIDKCIVKKFDNIPETFSIKDILLYTDYPSKDKKSLYDVLERMVYYGLIHKAKSKGYWFKDHEYRDKNGFKKWLIDYYEKVKCGNTN